MNKNYCCYSITNRKNGLMYIGKTSADTTRRWGDHIKSALSDAEDKQTISKAIAKHGIDAFAFDILKYYASEDAAYNGEIRYIKKYNTYEGPGYNDTPGGRGSGGSRRKLSKKDAKNLIRDYVYGDYTCYDLSEKYDLAKPSVLDILNRRAYIDVKISGNLRYKLWLKLHRPIYDDMNRENCNLKKLSKEQIKSIFKTFATGKYNLTQLSKLFNTTISNISFILKRETNIDVHINKKTLEKSNAVLYKLQSSIKSTARENRYQVKNEVFRDFRDGMHKKDIAKKYNIAIDRIVKILNNSIWKDIGLDVELVSIVQPKITQLTNEQAYQIIYDFIKNDMKIKDIANKYDQSTARIISILRRESFPKLEIGDLTIGLAEKLEQTVKYKQYWDIIPQIFERFVSGQSLKQIEKDLNISKRQIRHILHRRSYASIKIDPNIEEKVRNILLENYTSEHGFKIIVPPELKDSLK